MAGHLLEKAHHRIGQIDLVPPGIERGITAATSQVVQPGDRVRIENVLDAVQPTAKAGPPGATFPGMLGPATPVGSGRTDVVDDVAVLATCDFAATHDLDSLPNRPDGASIVDMAGPGARYSPWGSTTNVVISFTADPAVSLEEADRTIRRATLAVALITSALAAVVTRRVTRPIVQLTETAAHMARGDLDQQVSIDRKDEIGILARAFNRMAAELTVLYGDLEAKVAERTMQLEEANKQTN